MIVSRWMVLPLLGSVALTASGAPPVATPRIAETFTYQGVLTNAFGLIDGACELEFRLFDVQVGGMPLATDVHCFDGVVEPLIVNGLISVELDFGPGHFTGNARWLEIAVRCPCGPPDPFQTLTQRQLITPTPYAINALRLGGVLPSGYLANAVGVIKKNHIAAAAVGEAAIQAGAVNSSHLAKNPNSLGLVSGNVLHSTGSAIGIGTTNPSEALEVAGGDIVVRKVGGVGGDIHVDDDLFVDDNARVSGDLRVLNRAGIGVDSTGTLDGRLMVRTPFNGGDILNLYTGTTHRMTVTDLGYVGINTTNPSTFLHVFGSARMSNLIADGLSVIGDDSFDGTLKVKQVNSAFSIFTAYDISDNRIFTIHNTGWVGIGNPSPGARLHVRGQGSDPFPNADHIAIFENTGGASPDGIAIKLNTNFANSGNNFATFYDNGGVVGRIEGVNASDVIGTLLSFSEIVQLAQQLLSCMCDLAPPGCDIPNTPAELTALLNCVEADIGLEIACNINEYSLPGLLAFIDIGALPNPQFGAPAGAVTAVVTQMLCKYGGVTYGSQGADYAEWLPKLDAAESMSPGQIVGVQGGKVTKVTEGAEQVMVISVAPVVIGNLPPEGEESAHAKVAFMGQVAVWVRGVANVGDFIVPSGNNDGTGIAVAPEELRASQLHQVVGRAWSASASTGLGLVNVLVGVTNEWAEIAQRQADRIEVLEDQVESMTAQLALVENLSHRLVKLETLMARDGEAVALADMGGIHEEKAQ